MAPIPAEAGAVEQAATPGVANPAPLGLCAFALTTFVLSAANAKLYTGETIVIGLALFYGGLAQLLAGMWEFRTGNTFGATAFSSYGAFWLAVGGSIQWHWIPETGSAFAFFLLGWTIFTGLMFLAAFRLNLALITLFGLLFVTFLLLTLAQFGENTGQIGGYFGIATAIVAWYTALAGLLSAMPAVFKLPVGPRS